MNIKIEKDLTVVGAGISGMCAAVAAARKGLKVALINDRNVLGGNASSEIGVGISGSSHHGLNPAVYAKETGLVEEIRLMLLYYNRGCGYGRKNSLSVLDAVFMDFILNEPNIELFLNTTITKAEKEGDLITLITGCQAKTLNVYDFFSPLYIDSSGDAVAGFLCGADYRMGTEGKDEFQEKSAPEQAAKNTMGYTLFFETEDLGEEVIFHAPNHAIDISKTGILKYLHIRENFRSFSINGADWCYEYGGQLDTIKDFEEINFHLRQLTYGIWDYVKNSGSYPQAKNFALKRVYSMPGTRESRRLMGDYILNECDIDNNVVFKDSVATGGWPMDVHAPMGIYDEKPASNFIAVTGLFDIPFRCLYSKNISNLMMAGRDISASHIALGSTRVMATCGAMGQAVGTAAYLCGKYQIFPRELYNNYIAELQELLMSDDQTIINFNQSNKLAANWSICSSSEKAFENTKGNDRICLDKIYALSLMLTTQSIESIKIKIRNNSASEQMLKYKILTGSRKDTFIPDKLAKTNTVQIAPSFDDWLKLDISQQVGNDEKIYIVFEKNMMLSVCSGNEHTIGAVSWIYYTHDDCSGKDHDSAPLSPETGYIGCDHISRLGVNFLFKDIEPKQKSFCAENMLNGIDRPYGSQNLWISSDNKPQTIILKAKEMVNIKKLDIIFDTYLNNDKLPALPGCLVKRLEIEAVNGKGQKRKIAVDDNFKRFLSIEINMEEVKEIKLYLQESYGDCMGVYGIKAYS